MVQFNHSSPPLTAWLLTFTLVGILQGCTGGTGSADGKSALGTELGNPFSLTTALFYIRRPLPVNADELLEPFVINTGAHLYMRQNASLNAPEVNISGRIYGSGAQYDVKDLAVSADGEQLVFAMHAPEADPNDPVNSWNIWRYTIATDTLERVISDNFIAEEGDDIGPEFLPNGDIIFSSTRQSTAKGILLDEGKPQYSNVHEDSDEDYSAALHSIDNAETITQISFNQSHDFDPLVMSNGEILYSRWDNIANNDQVSLYSVSPIGGNMAVMYGFHSQSDPALGPGFVHNKRLLPDGNVLAILRTQDTPPTALGGDIVAVDVDNYIDLNQPTAANAGLQPAAIQSLSPNNVDIDNPKSPGGRYAAVWPVQSIANVYLVSWSGCRALDNGLIKPCSLAPGGAGAAPPLFGIWALDTAQQLQQPVVLGQEGMMISDLLVAEARSRESIFVDSVDTNLATDQQAILNIRSIYDLDGLDASPAGIAANADPAVTDPATIGEKFLRIVKGVSIPDEDVRDFDNSAFGVNASQRMREIIGYVPIEPDGSVRTLVPANVPLMISVVDADGKRVGQRHDSWIHLAPGATLQCVGCHANNSTEPHGRPNAQPPSVNPGAPTGSFTVFPNTEILSFVTTGGETMGEAYATDNLIAARTPSVDVVYTDDWTNDLLPGLNKSPPFGFLYQNLTTAAPVSIGCQTAWDERCRTIIHYETHIQPLWEEPRMPIDDGSGMNMVDTCIGCHTTNGGTQVPAAQLDLTATASDIDPDQFTSYRELLRNDGEQADNGGTVAERSWQCNIVDPQTLQPVPDGMGGFQQEIRTPTNTVPATMSEAGANFGNSPAFFGCMTMDNACAGFIGDPLPAGLPDECSEIGGTPVASWPTINHNGLLSPDELRLIAEWLDIGAQYYNNPFDAPL